MRAARASAPASRRARARPPARSSWRRRRPTSAPATRSSGPAASASASVSSVAGKAGGIGDRMPGFDHAHVPGRAAHSRAASPRGPRSGRRAGRGRRGSAAPRPRPSRRAALPAASTISRPDRGGAGRCGGRQCAGMRGRDRGVEQAFQEGAARFGHDQKSLPLRRRHCPRRSALSPVLSCAVAPCRTPARLVIRKANGALFRPPR